MPRIQLRLYVQPGQAEVTLAIKAHNENYERITAVIDTGAAVSLFPDYLLKNLDYRLSERRIIIEQAGIAGQAFEAVEAFVRVFLEDQSGSHTTEFEIRAWFADTDQPLLGFDGVLDRGILHIDMPNRDGWLEITA
ncbi:MAG: hypothetical protein H7Y09_10035 [Chitinophagaceae bacterium]|nr:hypothetical protein [Anaerolineae bacterium]